MLRIVGTDQGRGERLAGHPHAEGHLQPPELVRPHHNRGGSLALPSSMRPLCAACRDAIKLKPQFTAAAATLILFALRPSPRDIKGGALG